MLSKILQYFQLSKLIVSLSVTFTAITGFVYATHTINVQLFYLSIGVFLLSAGASALNQLQEKQIDKKMLRTQNRPLASLKMTDSNAIVFIFCCIVVGIFILTVYTSRITTLLGILNIIWYNGIYTPLKRKTAFAIIPGALCGVIPVVMGWFATQHSNAIPKLIFISIYMFIWQIPHFWLLLISYKNDYVKAGLPSITSIFKGNTLNYILLSWIIACIAFIQMSLFFGLINNPILLIMLFIVNIAASIYFIKKLLISTSQLNYKESFILLNSMEFLFMLFLVIDSLL